MATHPHVGRQLRDRPEFKTMPKPLMFGEATTAAKAITAMCEKNFGSVIVVDDDQKVLGVVTERDVMRKLINAGKDPETTLLSDIMTRNPRVANETDDVIDWLRIMSNERFRRLPVVDENGRLTVVFTQGDFVSYTWPDLIHEATAGARKSVTQNYPLWMLGGGIMLYSLLMVVVVSVI